MKAVTLPALLLLLACANAQAGKRECTPSDLLPDIQMPASLTSAVSAIIPDSKPVTGTTSSAAPAAAAPAAAGNGSPQLKRRVNELEEIVRKQNELIDLQNKRISELEARR